MIGSLQMEILWMHKIPHQVVDGMFIPLPYHDLQYVMVTNSCQLVQDFVHPLYSRRK